MEFTCKGCQVRTRRVPRQRPPRAAHALGVCAHFPRVSTRGTSADTAAATANLYLRTFNGWGGFSNNMSQNIRPRATLDREEENRPAPCSPKDVMHMRGERAAPPGADARPVQRTCYP